MNRAVSREHRHDFVRDMVDEGVGTITVLLYVRHNDPRQRRNVVGLPSHHQLGADDIDIELRPDCRADKGGYRDTGTDRSWCNGASYSDFKSEPIADFARHGITQLGLRNLEGGSAINVNIHGGSHTNIPRHNPSLIH